MPPGQAFDVPITIQTTAEIRGLEFTLQYDPSLVQCNSVGQGSFLADWAAGHGGSTIFIQGVISNTQGLVQGVAIAILLRNDTDGPTGQGLAATVHCQAGLTDGTSALDLSQALISVICHPGSEDACSVTAPAVDGQVTVAGGQAAQRTSQGSQR